MGKQADKEAAEQIKRVGERLTELEVQENSKLKRANRGDNLIWGLLIGIEAAVTILLIAQHEWRRADVPVLTIVWASIVLGLNHIINRQRLMINMLSGMIDIEHEEIVISLNRDGKK